MERAEAYRVHIEWALRQPGRYWQADLISARQPRSSTSDILNHRWAAVGRGINCRGWRFVLGFITRPVHLRREVARARVRAIWKQHPEFTAKQVIASLGLEHPLGIHAGLEAIEGMSCGRCQA